MGGTSVGDTTLGSSDNVSLDDGPLDHTSLNVLVERSVVGRTSLDDGPLAALLAIDAIARI